MSQAPEYREKKDPTFRNMALLLLAAAILVFIDILNRTGVISIY
jgi:hypothetical protein